MKNTLCFFMGIAAGIGLVFGIGKAKREFEKYLNDSISSAIEKNTKDIKREVFEDLVKMGI